VSTLSERAAAALVARQKAAAGVRVTYSRKSGGPALPLTAVEGVTAAESALLPGRVEISERDYLIAVADLFENGRESVPVVGDRITQTINGEVCVFEVQNGANGEKAWRYASQWRVLYRVHTKRVRVS
jgi:hypothetical protein